MPVLWVDRKHYQIQRPFTNIRPPRLQKDFSKYLCFVRFYSLPGCRTCTYSHGGQKGTELEETYKLTRVAKPSHSIILGERAQGHCPWTVVAG